MLHPLDLEILHRENAIGACASFGGLSSSYWSFGRRDHRSDRVWSCCVMLKARNSADMFQGMVIESVTLAT